MLISYKAIGRNIRVARKKTGQTQEQVAKKLGISLLHYGRLERGERPAALEQLAHIALTLEASLAQLLSGCIEGENFGIQPSADTKTLSDSVAAIADGCSEEAQKLMLSLCQTVAEHDKATQFKV